MSAIEQLSPVSPSTPTPAREIAHCALQSFNSSDQRTFIYRPDYMTESFADELAAELDNLGIDAIVVATWLKGVRIRKPNQTYAIELSAKKLADVIPINQNK